MLYILPFILLCILLFLHLYVQLIIPASFLNIAPGNGFVSKHILGRAVSYNHITVTNLSMMINPEVWALAYLLASNLAAVLDERDFSINFTLTASRCQIGI